MTTEDIRPFRIDVPQAQRDALLANVMIYWLNGTAGSSVRYYRDGADTWGEPDPPSTVPVAVAPHDIGSPVRRVAEESNNIVRWTVLERGGHFTAMEEPDLVVADLRAALADHR